MTGQPAAEPDDSELDSTYFAVSDIEGIAKVVIRSALPVDRFAMWEAYQLAVRDAAEASQGRMPWDPPEAVTRISARSSRRVLTAVLKAVPDEAEQARLAKVAQTEAERVEQRAEAAGPESAIPVGRHPIRHCASCGQPYRPKRARSTYCTHACKQAAYRARQAQRRALRQAARWRHPA